MRPDGRKFGCGGSPGGDEEQLAARWRRDGIPAAHEGCGAAGDRPEPVRSYARPARRQASTPDIPRAGRYFPPEDRDLRARVVLHCHWYVCTP